MTERYQVTALGARGDGIVTVDDKPAFIPKTVPGDMVTRDASGAFVLAEKGPHHAAARCSHNDQCGGCSLQQLPDFLYAEWMKTAISRALAQHDLEADILEPKISPPHSRRRCAVSGRWQGGQFCLGFAGEKSHALTAIDDCAVLDVKLRGIIAPFAQMLAKHVSRRQSVRMQLTLASNGLDVLLEGLDFDDMPLRQGTAFFAQDHPDICRVIGRDRGYTDILFQRDVPIARFAGGVVEMPVGAFLQATPQGEAAIVEAVLDRVIGRSDIADLFSGIGTISLALAKQAKVAAFEGSRPAIDALTKARQAKGAHGVTTHHRDLFRRPLSAAELAAYDAIVLDPPRAGAKAQCMELAKSKVAEIAFVSCNPNTFARDARLLSDGGYRLDAIQPIGQFLWSNHVELVARFCREGAY